MTDAVDRKAMTGWTRENEKLGHAWEREMEGAPTLNGKSFVPFMREEDRPEDAEADVEMMARKYHFDYLLGWIFAYGPSPDRVAKRFYALAWHTDRAQMAPFGVLDLIPRLGEVSPPYGEFGHLLQCWSNRSAEGLRHLPEQIRDAIYEHWKRGDAVLSAAYRRAKDVERRWPFRSYTDCFSEVRRLAWTETEAERGERQQHWRLFLRFLFTEGIEPERAVKMLYAITWCVARKHLLGMNIREVSDLLGEVRATGSNRIGLVFSDLLERWGFRGTRVSGQKKESSRNTYAAAAEGNTSRQKGKKKGDVRQGQ